jgi:hypothetical protein
MTRLAIRRSNLGSIITTCALVAVMTAAPVAAALVVRSVDIVNGEVKTVDLANLAVTNKKFASNSVNGAKVNESTLGIVPNANLLDGRDSTSFLAGSGRIVAASTTISRGNLGAVFSYAVAGQIGFNIAYNCPTGLVPPWIEFRDRSGQGWGVWFQDGGDDPVFGEVSANDIAVYQAFQETHSIKFRVARTTFSGPQATVLYSLTGGTTTCKAAALATLVNY